MGKRTYQNTKALRVSVQTTALDRMIARLQQGGIQAANDAIEEEAERQVRFAFGQWGVDTGQGRKSLKVLSRRRGSTFVVRVFSKHKPVRFQSWDGKRPTFWQVLIEQPLRKATKKLAKLAAKMIAQETQHGK